MWKKRGVFFFTYILIYLVNVFSKSVWRGDLMPFLLARCYRELAVLGEKLQSFVL